MDFYRQRFLEALSSIEGVSVDTSFALTFVDDNAVTKALDMILDYGCKTGHISNILLGREFLPKLPIAFLQKHLVARAALILDCADDYEYRRLCEAVKPIDAGLFLQVLSLGDSVENADVRETVTEYRERLA